MIEFKCAQCGAAIKAKPELAGRACRCPKCGAPGHIPQPDNAPSAPPQAARSAAAPPPRQLENEAPALVRAAFLSAPPPQIDPDAWQSAGPAAGTQNSAKETSDQSAKLHPWAYGACSLPVLLVFIGGLLGGALGGGAAAINVAAWRSRLPTRRKTAVIATTTIAAVVVWLAASAAIRAVLPNFGGNFVLGPPGFFSGHEPVVADYCTLLLAPKLRDELELDAPQRVFAADKARTLRQILQHPGNDGRHGMDAAENRMIEKSIRLEYQRLLDDYGAKVKALLREPQDAKFRAMCRAGTLRAVAIEQHGKGGEADILVLFTAYKEPAGSGDRYEERRKPDGGKEIRVTIHTSWTDEEVLEQIHTPEEAVAVSKSAGKDVAAWGVRWLKDKGLTPTGAPAAEPSKKAK